MILKNIRYLITQDSDRQILENIDLIIEDDEISGLGRNMPVEGHEVIDCSNNVVMPGLVNAHTHASMTLLRGISDNKELQEWLEEDIFPAEEKIEAYDAYIGALTASVEMLKTGTTTFNDMYAHMDQVAEAVDRTGIRAVLARGLLDIDGEREKRMNEALQLIESYSDHDRINVCFGPHSVYTASEQLLLEAKDAANVFDTKYHIHVSETRKEVQDSRDERGLTPLEYLDKLDLVNSDLIAAHGVWLTDEEKDLMEEKGGTVVHNPSANLKLGSGIAEVSELIDKGINVALRTDGVASNNNLNLLEEAKITSILHKRESPKHLDEQQVLDMMTVNGAQALGLQDQIGSIEIGKKADLVIIDLDNPVMRPFHGKKGIISNIIYSFTGPVNKVIVDGELVVDDGEALNINEKDLFNCIDDLAEKF